MKKMQTSDDNIIPHSRPDIDETDIHAVTDAMQNRHLAQGPVVERLEEALGHLYPDNEVVAVSSGTAAIYIALASLNLSKGREVILPSYTCNSLYSAVSFAGLKATPVDLAEGCLTPGHREISAALTGASAAVIMPHTFGYTAPIDEIPSGLPLIEDCAQSLGGRYPDGSPLGSRGTVTVLSFFATKILPAGEGGARITRDPALADRMRDLRDCDKRPPDPASFNFKMSDIHAAIAINRIKRLPDAIKERDRIAGLYDAAFGDRSLRQSIRQPQSVCARYLIDASDGAIQFQTAAADLGISCCKPVWAPLHQTLGGECPRTDAMHKRLLSIPIYPGLTEDQIERICSLASL